MIPDEEKFTLRDHLMIEILKLTHKHSGLDDMKTFINWHEMDTNSSSASFLAASISNKKSITHTIRGAYKLADLIRKIRLEIFE